MQYVPHDKPEPMDAHYQPFHRAAEELQNSFHARLNDPFNPMAMIVKHEADELVSDIASNKSPYDVEERVKTIQGHLMRAKDTLSGSSFISEENNRFLHDRYGRLRRDLQDLQNKPYFDQPRTNGSDQSSQSPSPRGGRPWL